MEKIELTIEALKELLKRQEYVSTKELYESLKRKGLLNSTNEKVERRKLLRALKTLEELGYVNVNEKSKEKFWQIRKEEFKFLLYLDFEELTSFIFLLSLFPKTYKDIPLFSKAFNAISRYENELSEEERELLKLSFERVPTFNERYVKIEEEYFKLIVKGIIKKELLYIQYKNKGYIILPIKIFSYNGLFYLGSLTEKGELKTFLISRIEKVIPMGTSPSQKNSIKREEVIFEIPRELPFLFGAVFPESYARETEIKRGIKFSPFQFYIEKTKEGILTYLVGFTGRRFASWFLMEKVRKLIKPNQQIIKIAKEKGIKKEVKKLTYQLRENERRFQEFIDKSLKLINQKQEIYKKNG
ncbi:helix-turn-helix transcriptional regulator [Thermovibrio sp.]